MNIICVNYTHFSVLSFAQEDGDAATNTTYWRPPNRGMVRGRGCNDSFRAAVDHSYEEKEAAAAAAAAHAAAMAAMGAGEK